MNNKSTKITDFIYRELSNPPADIVDFISKKFGFSRQNALRYITREIKNGKIIKTGRTKTTRYFIVGGKNIEFSYKIIPGLAEDQIWSKYVKPTFLNYPENIKRII